MPMDSAGSASRSGVSLPAHRHPVDCMAKNALVNERILLPGHKPCLPLREASWILGRNRAFVSLLVGLECAVLIVGEKFIFTRP